MWQNTKTQMYQKSKIDKKIKYEEKKKYVTKPNKNQIVTNPVCYIVGL